MGFWENLPSSALFPSIGVGITCVLVYLFIWSYKNPEKLLIWAGMTQKLRLKVSRYNAHNKITSFCNKLVQPRLRSMSEKMGGGLPKEIRVTFVDPDKYGRDFLEAIPLNGHIDIIKAWEDDTPRSLQRIIYAVFHMGSFKNVRPFMNPIYMEGLDIVLTLSTLDQIEQRAPLNSFLNEVFVPILKRKNEDDLKTHVKKFKDLDAAGLLATILARELNMIDKKIFHSADASKVDSEMESVLLFLDELRHKERGEKVELDFKGSLTTFSVIPVGGAVARVFGDAPYINRIKNTLKDVPRIYLWGVGNSNAKMVDRIARYKFEGKVVARIETEYHTHDFRVLEAKIAHFS